MQICDETDHVLPIAAKAAIRFAGLPMQPTPLERQFTKRFLSMRNAIRTFRLDRIQHAVDLETGEIIPDMTAYAAQKYAESPTASLDKLLGDAADSLRALFYIGKADGRFTAKEKKIFLDFCQAAAGDARITQRHIDDLCAQMDIPTQQSFKLICGRIAKSGHEKGQQVLRAAEAMIATEKTISGNEAEALDYLRRRLAPTG